MSLNSEEHIDYLCSLLYKLSKVKKNSFFSHLYHFQPDAIPNTKIFKTLRVLSGNSSIEQNIYIDYKYKSSDLSDKLLKASLTYIEIYKATFNTYPTIPLIYVPTLLSTTQLSGLRDVDITENADIITKSISAVPYLQNPLLIQFSYCNNYTGDIFKLLSSDRTAKYNVFEMLNNWLFNLYQLVSLDKRATQKNREFYTQLNQRNQSVQKLIASISANLVLKQFCQIDISWNTHTSTTSIFDVEDFSMNHHAINNLRIQLLSTLRNEFSKLKNLLPVKYLWLLTSNHHCKVSIELHIITQNHEKEGFEGFHASIEQLLAKFHRIAQMHEFNVSVLNHQNPVINKMDKAQVLKELSFKESGYFIDFPELPKSSFGCGGIGGRKYK